MNNPDTRRAETDYPSRVSGKLIPGDQMQVGERYSLVNPRYTTIDTGNRSQRGEIVEIKRDAADQILLVVRCEDGPQREWYAKNVAGRKLDETPVTDVAV